MIPLVDLLREVLQCNACAPPHGPRPVVRVHRAASLLIIGQAPGARVHASGIPWDDPSGDRLRSWLQLDKEQFYDSSRVALMPMAFCYPGKGRSGDLPPPALCAELWHESLLEQMPAVRTTLLVGQYAQSLYLHNAAKTLTERVQNWRQYAPRFWPMPHPSPRNSLWLRRNPWFEQDVIPTLRQHLQSNQEYNHEEC